MRKIFLSVLFALLAMQAGWAEEDCRLTRVVALDMIPGPFGVVVPAALGEHPLQMAVDTGGYLTALNESKATELGLNIQTEAASGMFVFGGIALHHYVVVSDFALGRLKARRLEYPLLPPGLLPDGVDGILSPDFIANFDVDFDFAQGKVNLFRPHPCDGKVGYWIDGEPPALDFYRDDNLHIKIPVTLDGKKLKAVVDTGASVTTMSMETAKDVFDLADNDPRLTEGPRISGTEGNKIYPFKEMRFGDVVVSNPKIVLVADHKAQLGPQAPDLILGLTVLRQLHLYVAYKERVLYVTPASAHR